MPHDAYPDSLIRDILKSVKRIALVGASANEARPSWIVTKYLIDKGYDVIPVNPGLAGQSLLGEKVFASLSEIEDKIDMVDVFRRSDTVASLVDEAIAIKAKFFWMQLGVVNAEAAARARAAGLRVVMDRCPKIEIPRLGLLR